MQELTIDSIRVSPMNYQRVVILKEKDSDRYLPIWIGPSEADAIAVKLQDLSVPRPLTHDLLGTVIDTLGGEVSHILVNDLENDTFYAKIVIKVDDKIQEIDSRPSDALAVALRMHSPILVANDVMEEALTWETDTEKIENEIQEEPQVQLLERQLQKAIDKEEYEMAARIRDKIKEIDS